MRLTPFQRLALLGLTTCLLALAILGATKDWPVALFASLLPVWIAGLFVIHGAVPHGSWKDLSFQWPELDTLNRVETVEKSNARLWGEFEQLLGEARATRRRLDDWIIAQDPEDEHGDLDGLREYESGVSTDVAWRDYSEEGYDDGISTEDLRKIRDGAYDAVELEERRQDAIEMFRKERESRRVLVAHELELDSAPRNKPPF